MTLPTLLIADDEPVVLSVLGKSLAAPGRTVLLAGSAAEARALARQEGPIDVALLDRHLGDGSGLELAAELRRSRAETEVILVTTSASFEAAVEALQAGVYDYLSKPIDDFDALRLRLDNAFAKVRLVGERRLAEAEARQLQKMDAIGRLAGGIGHDLANMLAVILSWVEELTPQAEGPVREGLDEIEAAAGRATRLVRHMMTLSRKGPASPEVLSLNQVLGELAKLLRRSLGAKVTLVLEPGPELWPVVADPSHLTQVCLNLAVNARDAMPSGGTLTIRTANLGRDARAPGDGLPEGDLVLLTVADQGTGMTEEVRQRVFEPFF
ncbi:MAG: response regulator, partial [Anaeromyxobacteraceae bacterium]|nr:response regulator [Anaeromyxobacteraceae bacterium]